MRVRCGEREKNGWRRPVEAVCSSALQLYPRSFHPTAAPQICHARMKATETTACTFHDPAFIAGPSPSTRDDLIKRSDFSLICPLVGRRRLAHHVFIQPDAALNTSFALPPRVSAVKPRLDFTGPL